MTDLEKIKHYMDPYYQDVADEVLLTAYLDEYDYPECAASVLWYESQGKLGLSNEGVIKIDTGAEKFQYSEPGTLQLACQRNGRYYADRCRELHNNGSVVARVTRTAVGGVTKE